VLFIVEMGLMLKAIRKGPDPDHEPEAPLVPEKLVAAE
jgi:cytochrome bd ubiquinol oxidase subunit I